MPASTKFALISTTKPKHIFYIWYSELCRRSNVIPLASVKPAKLKSDTVLDFTVDRIKYEEWDPVLCALRLDTSLHVISIRSRIAGCKFLYEINAEEKLRQLNKKGNPLWTDYLIRVFIVSLGNCLKVSSVLSTLQLEGLPIYGEYFQMLLENLKYNKTIKNLSLQRCAISDIGCYSLCQILYDMNNVETLNLSSCNLSSVSGEYLANVVKHQQLNRYSESWHTSLRYNNPDPELMVGLKRLTLNNNPLIGDDGLNHLLTQLEDDLWIRALDMQKCNITENLGKRIIDVVRTSQSLIIADFRNNDKLSLLTINTVLHLLEDKNDARNDEYNWCDTVTSINELTTFRSSQTSNCTQTNVRKAKSWPLKQDYLQEPVRKCKTTTFVDQKCNASLKILESKEYQKIKFQLDLANSKLHEEKCRRIEMEKRNHILQKKLSSISNPGQDVINGKVFRRVDSLPQINNREKNVSKNPVSKHFLDTKQSNLKRIPTKTIANNKQLIPSTTTQPHIKCFEPPKLKLCAESNGTSKILSMLQILQSPGIEKATAAARVKKTNRCENLDSSFESDSTASLEKLVNEIKNKEKPQKKLSILSIDSRNILRSNKYQKPGRLK